MGLNAAVQALRKAEPLKDKVQRCTDLLNDNEAWICQQQLQKIYQKVLILDLEYALDKKVEQELWNLGFKNYIAILQNQIKDRKNPNWVEAQAMLSWCLEAASGFYLTLLQEICTAFDLDIPFRRKAYIYGTIPGWESIDKQKCAQQFSLPHKSSCFYVCQYCLVHLGDIARYRNESRQAELFYRHAVSLAPSSGQPYNQLALLEASRGDKLGTVFHYTRSVAVKHPFPAASANLAKTLSSTLTDDDTSCNISKSKLSAQEYITIFLKFHGALHNQLDEITKKKSKNTGKTPLTSAASSYIKILTDSSLTALIATESFTSWRLTQMLIVNLYTLHHTSGNSGTMELLPVEQLSSDEKIARHYALEIIAGSLSALLLPVYTLKNAPIDYFALPSIKLCLDWIRLQETTLLEDPAFTTRLQIWPSLCTLLNGLHQSLKDFNYDQFSTIPLPEDRDLQGFLPLERSFESLKFSHPDSFDAAFMKNIRAMRILNLGRYLTQCQVNGLSLINTIVEGNNECKFTCVTDGVSNELMKELEELTEKKKEVEVHLNSEKKVGGILKPQQQILSSSEPAVNSCPPNLPAIRRVRQNVAMQAIMRRAETEQKQVTFGNISPMIIEATEETPETLKPEANIDQKSVSAMQQNFSQTLKLEEAVPQSEKISGPPQTPANQFFPTANDKKSWWQQVADPNSEAYTKFPMTPPQFPPQSPFTGSAVGPQGFLPPCNPQSTILPGPLKDCYPSVIPPVRHPAVEDTNLRAADACIAVGPIQHIPQESPINHFNPMPQQQMFPPPHMGNNHFLVGQNRDSANFNAWKEVDPAATMAHWWRGSVPVAPMGNTENFEGNMFPNWPRNPTVSEAVSPMMGYNYPVINKNGPVANKWNESRVEKPVVTSDMGNVYSLFSGNTSWGAIDMNGSNQSQQKNSGVNQSQQPQPPQSLWSGPGPSPLERLLEQQKSLREGGT